MKFKQHIEVGKYLYEQLEKDNKINRIAYLFGNVAPDLNCVYPAHRLRTTEKRFYKRLVRIDNTHFNILKSFTLGVVTHYICDYFCYAHSIESLGIKHKIYETNLYNYYNMHLQEIQDTKNRLRDAWKSSELHNKYMNSIDDELTSKQHCDMILEQVKIMNKLYMDKSEGSLDKNWMYLSEQMKRDLEYASFMTESILRLILQPYTCSAIHD